MQVEYDKWHYNGKHISEIDLPFSERVKRCIAHAENHGQMNNVLWPNMPFSVTIGELLKAATK